MPRNAQSGAYFGAPVKHHSHPDRGSPREHREITALERCEFADKRLNELTGRSVVHSAHVGEHHLESERERQGHLVYGEARVDQDTKADALWFYWGDPSWDVVTSFQAAVRRRALVT
jgi:hypothetical protein